MYVPDKGALGRYFNYLDRYKNYASMGISNLIFIDDGSNPSDLVGLKIPIFLSLPPELPPVSIYTFPDHLGRLTLEDFPGWWRSFKFSAILAETYGFERILHLESDAVILSEALKDYLSEKTSGWSVLWCPFYKMPETQIQVICKDQFEAVKQVVPRAKEPEFCLPFTSVIQDFKGDRHHEVGLEIPPDADFSCQLGG